MEYYVASQKNKLEQYQLLRMIVLGEKSKMYRRVII